MCGLPVFLALALSFLLLSLLLSGPSLSPRLGLTSGFERICPGESEAESLSPVFLPAGLSDGEGLLVVLGWAGSKGLG